MVKGNLIKGVEGEKAWVTYAKKRVRDNQNFVCVITGETGSGKSYSALSYCLQIDPEFDIRTQVVFYFKDLMEVINDEEFQKKPLKIILWDEIQIDMSNRKWQSKLNMAIIQLLSTFRAQNIILIMTAPNKSMLDAQVKKLLHAEFKCEGFVKKTNLCKIRPRYSQYNPDKDRIYPHKLMVILPNHGYTPIDIWQIKKAPPEKLEIYEEKKRRFNIELNKRISSSLVDPKNEKTVEGYDKTKRIMELIEKHNGNILEIHKEIPEMSLISLRSTVNLIKKSIPPSSVKEPPSPYVLS